MGTLHAAIEALETVSIVLGMVPLIGDNLKSAAELASKICEQVQKLQENREGYEQIGVQVTELLTTIASVLQQTRQDEALEQLMQTNVKDLLKVLEEIKVAVEKRVHSDAEPGRKRDLLFSSIRKKATDAKRKYKDQDDLEEMRRKLQSVVDGFMISSLIRNELNSLHNGRDLNAVRILASQILELQVRKDVKFNAEAERIKQDADIALLDSLEPVMSAAWNAEGADGIASTRGPIVSMCTPGTRVAILSDLQAWAVAPEEPCVFWLNGLAGTGKSTIARSLCEGLDEKGLLGASFFVSRDQPDRRDASKIVRSLAHQLASKWPKVSDALCAKLRKSPLSVARSLQQQITDFMITPSRGLPTSTSVIVVIDALDESVTDYLGRPGGDLLLLLGRQLLPLAGRIKLLITSRNELPIQKMFHELSATLRAVNVVKLHELDKAAVQSDITTYLTHSFNVIRDTRLDLALTGWPTLAAIDKLVELSGLLFIYAATAVRFVTHRRHSPRERLAQLLDQAFGSESSPYSQLDGLYRQILDSAVGDPDENEASLCKRLQAVMAVIILAQTPLNIDAVSFLSGVGPDGVGIVIGSLASLLADSTSSIRVFHPSFADFIVDGSRCTDFRLRVVPTVGHGVIGLRCLELMNKHLRYDICGIQNPTVANRDVKNLHVALHENVSDALHYAACFWCTHLAASESPDRLLVDALDEFCQKHLFHWVEILSLIENVAPAEAALLKLIEWCEKHSSHTTTRANRLLRDLVRSLQVFATPIRSHALHTYHSAFTTMPQCLLLDTLAEEDPPIGLPRLVSPRAEHWGPAPRVLEGHSHSVTCLAYSSDDTHIVSGSDDRTLCVWNAVTFNQLATLKGHRSWVKSVAYSPDGTCIVSGGTDGTVRIWNAATFQQIAKLSGHQDWINCVAFSPDGTHVISSSEDCTVRLWSAVTFEKVAEFEGNQDWVKSIAYSPDGTRIVSGSDDGTVRIWNVTTCEQVAKLQGHQRRVKSVACSSDGSHIASGSEDCTVRIWSASTFEQLSELNGHHGWVNSVAFSPSGAYIVSGSEDCALRVWSVSTAEQLVELKGHQGSVNSAIFSHSGQHIVSGSYDRTMFVWDAVTFEQVANLEGHISKVNCVAFSPNDTCVVSGSDNRPACVWDVFTFKKLAELKHQSGVNSIAFSPDGAHIVSGTNTRTVCVWSAVTFEQLAELDGHQYPVNHVAFSRGNNVIDSRDFSGQKLSWICNNGDFAIWQKVPCAESPSSTTSPAEMSITLSDSGWLNCSYGAKHTLLWLPVERRGPVYAGRGRRVVVGAKSGAVTLLELPSERT